MTKLPSSSLLVFRVVALGICKLWQAALKDLPLVRFTLKEQDEVLCKWAVLTKPSVLELEVCCGKAYADLLPPLLHMLPHKVREGAPRVTAAP